MSNTSSTESALAQERISPAATRAVKVWDVPTRIFHWSIVALVAIAWATAEEEGAVFVIHSLAGYAVLAALIFRIIWGFAGGAYARFSSFLLSWSVVASYTRQLMKRSPPRFVGHNPLGGWMIIALLAVLALLVVSGLFAQGEEGIGGPWAQAAIGLLAKEWYELHETLFNVLLTLVVIHVAGVVVDQVLTGDKLVRAMFTGVKRVHATEKILGAAEVGTARALGVLVIALIVVGFAVGWRLPSGTTTDSNAQRQAEREHASDREGEHN